MTRREFIAAATVGAAGQPLTTTVRVAPPIRSIAFDAFAIFDPAPVMRPPPTCSDPPPKSEEPHDLLPFLPATGRLETIGHVDDG